MSRILLPDEPIGTVDRFFDVIGDIAAAGIHDLFVADKIKRAAEARLARRRCIGCSHPSHDPLGCTAIPLFQRTAEPCRCEYDRSQWYLPNGLPQ